MPSRFHFFDREGDPSPAGLLLATGLAVFIATVLLLPHEMVCFEGRAEYNLWRVSMGIQWTLWLAGSFYAWSVIRKRGFRRETFFDAVMLLAVLLGTGLLANQNRVCPEMLPSRLHVALSVIAVGGLLATGSVAVASWSNAAAIRGVQTPQEFLALRTESANLLAILGASLTAATIGAGLFIRAANVAVHCGAAPELVIAYGLMYSLLLAVVWLPNYIAVTRQGAEMINTIADATEKRQQSGAEPVAAANVAALTLQQLETRSKIASALHLGTSVFDQLKAAAYVLAPLLTAVVSLALPTKK